MLIKIKMKFYSIYIISVNIRDFIYNKDWWKWGNRGVFIYYSDGSGDREGYLVE